MLNALNDSTARKFFYIFAASDHVKRGCRKTNKGLLAFYVMLFNLFTNHRNELLVYLLIGIF